MTSQMQPLSAFALPGHHGCPELFQLCAFQSKSDVFFIGFIANKFSNAVQIYPSQSLLNKEDIKFFQPLVSEMGTQIVITPIFEKAS